MRVINDSKVHIQISHRRFRKLAVCSALVVVVQLNDHTYINTTNGEVMQWWCDRTLSYYWATLIQANPLQI